MITGEKVHFRINLLPYTKEIVTIIAERTGEAIAVKTFNYQSMRRPLDVQMREFEVLKKLNHENIVRLLDIEEDVSTRGKILVTELCTGGSLFNILTDPENAYGMEEAEFLTVLHDVAAGMKHLRDQGIVHRDIKPGNIMKYIGADGRSVYKLIDFGAARELQDEEQFMSLYGTEEYLHPDLYERAVLLRPMGKQFGATVDLWSLGVTLYHLAAGQLPFRPYGGRRNKDTMYRITTGKESGVISGVQNGPEGPIEWSRELPPSCRLSASCKSLIVPLLAGLMECSADEMWGFEKFFRVVSNITSKKLLYVFSACRSALLHIYIDDNESFTKLQELIAEQTDVHANNQNLLFENYPMTQHVDNLGKIAPYPHTTRDNPIFMYYRDGTDNPTCRSFYMPPKHRIDSNADIERDVSLARNCTGLMFYIRWTVNEILNVQQLFHKAAKMFLLVVSKDVDHMRQYMLQYRVYVEETMKRLRQIESDQELSKKLSTLLSAGTAPDTLDDCRGPLNRLQISFSGVEQDLEDMRQSLEGSYEQICLNRQLSTFWEEKRGCSDDDRCCQKVNVLTDSVEETLREFRRERDSRDKFSRRWSQKEEKYHKFHKIKLGNLMKDSYQLYDDHCYTNLNRVFEQFKVWYCKVFKAKPIVYEVEKKLARLEKDQEYVVSQLDKYQAQQKKTLEVITHSLTRTTPSTGQQPQVQATTAVIQDASERKNAQDKKCRAQKKMRELNDSLKALGAESNDVKTAVLLNADLLKELTKLTVSDSPANNRDI